MSKKLQKLQQDPIGYCLDSSHGLLRAMGRVAYGWQTRRFEKLGAENGDAKITVIMTAYNTGRLVEGAIQSVLEQTHQNFELMVIDDASTDDTLSILKKLAAQDTRIRVFHSPTNHGTYWSKNWCLRQADTEFVTFHDSDDVSVPKRLQTQLGAMLANGSRISVTSRWRRVDEAGDLLVINGKETRTSLITLMIRRKDVLQKVGYFDSVRIAADAEYIQRIQRVFGVRRHSDLRQFLYTGLLRDGSLTRGAEGGYDWTTDGNSVTREMKEGDRAAYHRAFEIWQSQQIEDKSDFLMSYPLKVRLFPAPDNICVGCNDMDLNQVLEVTA